MPRHYTETEIFARIDSLSAPRLQGWLRARIIRPVQSAQGNLYREVDIARLALLCDLEDSYHLDDEALALVMSLLDQAHELRAQMHCLIGALAHEPDEVRHRLREMIAAHEDDTEGP